MLFYQPVFRGHYSFEAMEGSHSCTDRHFFELLTKCAVVVGIQIGRTCNRIIDPAGVQQVLIKRVIKVKMVESLKMQLGKVAVKEMRVLQTQDIPGGLRMSHEVATLLDAKK